MLAFPSPSPQLMSAGVFDRDRRGHQEFPSMPRYLSTTILEAAAAMR